MNGPRLLAATCACTLALLGAALPARADSFLSASGLQGAGIGMHEGQRARVYVDHALYVDDSSGISSPIFGAGFLAGPHLEIEAIVPVSISVNDDDTTPIVGNPYLGASYIAESGMLRLKIGAGLALPVLHVNEYYEFVATLGALGTRGFQESWLWMTDALSIVTPLHVEARVAEPVALTLDGALILAAPVRDREDMEFSVQVAPGVAFRPADFLVLGTRLTVFSILTEDTDDNTQLALEPFVRVEGQSLFATTRLTINLDDPYGFAFDDDGVWGFHLGVGGGF